jgi:UDP-N-acetylglucosamine 2-epimerase
VRPIENDLQDARFHAGLNVAFHESSLLGFFGILTDSGGIQEETTYLGKPCLTLRENTERPSTVTQGTNILIKKLDKKLILKHIDDISSGRVKKGTVPKFWDGKTAERIVKVLKKAK